MFAIMIWLTKYRIRETLLYVYSRLSLFRLSEMRPPRYTGHLVWHGMLAICFLHKTRPEVRPPRYSVYRPVLSVPNKVFNVILYVYYGRI